MMVGWFVVMNVLQPRLMADAVGLHPIVVLASVIIGAKVAGVAGAIFGIPIAAVLSSLFFHYLEIFGEDRTVAARAARRVETPRGPPDPGAARAAPGGRCRRRGEPAGLGERQPPRPLRIPPMASIGPPAAPARPAGAGDRWASGRR